MSKETDENKAIIQLFLDAWNSRRPDAFDDLVAPNVVRHCEATPDVQIRSLDHLKGFSAAGHDDISGFCTDDQTYGRREESRRRMGHL